ncbi:uncharacterized protein LOC116129087 [Pistacia vera]|uniref:uncharacterized protein LOC116123761 n=1 Tax=Pistacia vera TaxID=55513 RepID=UPI0012636C87|nr:uncharacterized protein LOC116123761 [Pistacia vera]XP_031270708.1 uncharacterized protein LOC116129087 [Pistacia vera]
MSAVTVAGRSTSIFARTILRSTPSRTRLSQVSVSNGFVPSNFSLRSQSRIIPTPSPCRLLRRELSSLVPLHSAISAACLVSKLPSEASASIQGRFANYLSPI